jgi:hypothetical protein
MITSVLARRRLRANKKRPAEQRGAIRRHTTRVLCGTATAGIALSTLGLAGAITPASAATQSLSPPVYTNSTAGYQAHGRLFRFASTTLTVPPRIMPTDNDGDAVIGIYTVCPGQSRSPSAEIYVEPGGRPDSVVYQGFLTGGQFKVSPHVGDQLTVSVYYDRQGHNYFTATDLTQHTTQTLRETLPAGMRPAYDHAELNANVIRNVAPSDADTQLWQFTGTRLTTYTGVHGTIQGPWQTSELVDTADGTSTSTVVASPSGLSNNGQDFGAWLRALPLAHTDGLAGYETSSGRGFRFASTTLTVPAATQPASAGDIAVIWLGQTGPTPRAYATITVHPGGGADSVSYAAEYGPSSNAGTFAVSPQPGDRLSVSVYYDQRGHDYFTASDLTQAATQTVQVNADLGGTAYTTAVIAGRYSTAP